MRTLYQPACPLRSRRPVATPWMQSAHQIAQQLARIREATEDAMLGSSAKTWNGIDRRSFIGGSDARIIMGNDEAALLHLWQEKRGEVEP